MSQKLFSEVKNNSFPLDLKEIPILKYDLFYEQVSHFLESEAKHCVAYYGVAISGILKFFCYIADDNNKSIAVFSHELDMDKPILKSLTKVCTQLQIFEREIHENFGVEFNGHPWLKPLRYSYDRFDKSKIIGNYPFYTIESEELHEVGVGPVHAGLLNQDISGLSVMVKKYCISKFNLGINIVELKNYSLKEKIHCKDVSFQKV